MPSSVKFKLLKTPFNIWDNPYGILSSIMFLVSIPVVLPSFVPYEFPKYIRILGLLMHLNGWYVIAKQGYLTIVGNIAFENQQIQIYTKGQSVQIPAADIQTIEMEYHGYYSLQKRYNRLVIHEQSTSRSYYILIRSEDKKHEFIDTLKNFLIAHRIEFRCYGPKQRSCQDEEFIALMEALDQERTI